MSETDMAALFRHFDSKIDALVHSYESKLTSKIQEEEKIFELLTKRMEAVSISLTSLEKRISQFETIHSELRESMPNGDFAGHARYHEEVMKALADKAAFWKKMKESVATWGAIGLLGLVSTAVWKFIIQGPHI